jgi:5-methyltetrahydrofolate--homocysteine methyltransferase
MSENLSRISTAVIEGSKEDSARWTQDALNDGLDAQVILNEGLMPGMNFVGVEFRAGNMYVPEVLRSARAMHSSMALLKPLLIEGGVEMIGKVLLGTVKGDIHDIGKNLVSIMCEGAGFEIKDLGINVAPEAFVAAIKEFEPDILGMSALLSTTMLAMEQTINVLQEAGVRDGIKVMVGGAPVTQSFADQIGADGYASNAAAAVDLAKELVGAD